MKIGKIRFNKPIVLVLGAGATRGASFVENLNGPLPPLDADFFTQAQRLSGNKPLRHLKALIKSTVEVFGPNFSLTLEDLFTQIEHLSNVFDDYGLKRVGRPRKNPYPTSRDQLMQVLFAVLDESISHEPECSYHQKIVESLSAEDTVLTFNYDWLMDKTLSKYAKNIWNPRIGYGVPAYKSGSAGKNTEFWAYKDPNTSLPQYPRRSLLLLKMHGSMNWFPLTPGKAKPRLYLRTRWWHQYGTLKFEIVPPEWNKPIRSGVYREIWTHARDRLRKTEALALIGYSLAKTDLPTQALFRVDGGNLGDASPLKFLIIINPDSDARKRIRQVLGRRISPVTRVVTFDCLKDFAGYLHE